MSTSLQQRRGSSRGSSIGGNSSSSCSTDEQNAEAALAESQNDRLTTAVAEEKSSAAVTEVTGHSDGGGQLPADIGSASGDAQEAGVVLSAVALELGEDGGDRLHWSPQQDQPQVPVHAGQLPSSGDPWHAPVTLRLGNDKQAMAAEMSVTTHRGSTVSFHDIHYEVMVRGPKCCNRKVKKILDGVSGVFKPGTMNAVMGPTGCGKSSLLDILAGRKGKQGISGLVLIDGQKQPDDFRLMSGYVVQDDLIMGTLTVRENLRFSANLRLPKTLSAQNKAERVSRIIDELGLQKCADTKIGNEFIRGVSGGERKRTSIGMELITSPRVLFLDEPTTGLDANTAKSVMLLLQRLAESGSTIIFSIHQPRFSIYKLCDTLHLLGNGETIYFGPSLQGMDFFKTLGYTIEEHDNPADFYLDIINSDAISAELQLFNSSDGGFSKLSSPDVVNGGDGMQVVVVDDDSSPTAAKGPSKLRTHMFADAFKKSIWNTWLQSDLQRVTSGTQGHHNSPGDPVAEKTVLASYHVSSIYQFGVVCGRTMKNFLRNPRTSYMQLVTTCFFALVTGAIYFGVDNSCDSGIQNRVGAFFFMIMNMVFGNLSAVDLFIQERTLFMHEHASGFYRVSSYFWSKVVCDIVPNRALPAVAYSAITYWMIGFYPDAGNFFFFLLNMVLTSFVACSLSFAISAATRQNAVASLLIGLCYVIMMIFSGLLVNIKNIAEWLKWLQWFSIFRYSLRALSINELKDRSFYSIVNGSSLALPDCTGNSYLTKQGISYEMPWDLWQNEVAMAVMSAILLVISYVQLRFGDRKK